MGCVLCRLLPTSCRLGCVQDRLRRCADDSWDEELVNEMQESISGVRTRTPAESLSRAAKFGAQEDQAGSSPGPGLSAGVHRLVSAIHADRQQEE